VSTMKPGRACGRRRASSLLVEPMKSARIEQVGWHFGWAINFGCGCPASPQARPPRWKVSCTMQLPGQEGGVHAHSVGPDQPQRPQVVGGDRPSAAFGWQLCTLGHGRYAARCRSGRLGLSPRRAVVFSSPPAWSGCCGRRRRKVRERRLWAASAQGKARLQDRSAAETIFGRLRILAVRAMK